MPTNEWQQKWRALCQQLVSALQIPRGFQNPQANVGLANFTSLVWGSLTRAQRDSLDSEEPAEAIAGMDVKQMWQDFCNAASASTSADIPVPVAAVKVKVERAKEVYFSCCKHEIRARAEECGLDSISMRNQMWQLLPQSEVERYKLVASYGGLKKFQLHMEEEKKKELARDDARSLLDLAYEVPPVEEVAEEVCTPQKKLSVGDAYLAIGKAVVQQVAEESASTSVKDNRSHTAQLVRWTNQLVENAAGSTGRKILRTVGIPPTPRATPQESIYSTPTKGEKPKSVSDERLRTMLSKHCRESRKPAHRVNSTMLVLDGSIRQIHAKDKELRGMISYDYLAHRVRPHAPALGVGAARIDNDYCSTCHCFDRVLQPEGTRLIKKNRIELKAHDQEFFAAFDARCSGEGWVPEEKEGCSEKISCDCWSFLAAFENLLQDGSEVAGATGMTASLALAEFRKYMEEVAPFVPHWKRRNAVYIELHKCLNCEEDFCLFMWCDWMENWNTPIGPRRVEEEWRAQARVQTSCHASIFWGYRLGKQPLVIVSLSRITDKSPHFTGFVMEKALDELVAMGVLQWINVLKTWTDNAVSYKCAQAQAFHAYYWPQKYGIAEDRGGIHCTGVPFEFWEELGEPCHLKGKVDRLFGQLDGRVKEVAKGKTVKNLDCIAAILPRTENEDGMREKFQVIWPDVDRADWVRDHSPIDTRGWPAGIRSSFSYEHRVNDIRRRELLGNDKRSISGVDSYSHGVPGLKRDTGKLHLELMPVMGPIWQMDADTDVRAAPPVVGPPGESSGDESSESESGDGDAAAPAIMVPESQKSFRGWKLSYRMKKPEETQKDKILKKAKARNAGTLHLMSSLPEARRVMVTPGKNVAEQTSRRKAQSAANTDFRKKFKADRGAC